MTIGNQNKIFEMATLAMWRPDAFEKIRKVVKPELIETFTKETPEDLAVVLAVMADLLIGTVEDAVQLQSVLKALQSKLDAWEDLNEGRWCHCCEWPLSPDEKNNLCAECEKAVEKLDLTLHLHLQE